MNGVWTLLRYRARMARHAADGHSVRMAALGALGIVAAAVAAGAAAAPALLTTSEAHFTAQVRAVAIPGLRALEAAFWLSATLAAVQCFRVMELLFRRDDVVALSLLPISARALFAERTLTAVAEATGVGLVLTAFFVPVAWSAPLVGLLCATLVLGGQLSAVCAALGATMWFGDEYGHPEKRVGGDAYGSSGGAFIYAPGAALALTLIAIVLLQLTLGEVLKAGHITRAFWIGLALVAGVSGWSLTVARRAFARYHLIAAWFREADSVAFTTDVTYQTTRWRPVVPERFGARPATARRSWLQWNRFAIVTHSLTSFLLGCGVLASFWMLEHGVTPFVVLPLGVVLVLAPWSRANANVFGNAHASVLPVTQREELVATVWMFAPLWIRGIAYTFAVAGIAAFQGHLWAALWGAPALMFAPFAAFAVAWRILGRRPGALLPMVAGVAACGLGIAAPMWALSLWLLPLVVFFAAHSARVHAIGLESP